MTFAAHVPQPNSYKKMVCILYLEDRKPLTQAVEIPQDLQEQAEQQLKEAMPQGSELEKVDQDLLKACAP